jgi:hypothetical protein
MSIIALPGLKAAVYQRYQYLIIKRGGKFE